MKAGYHYRDHDVGRLTPREAEVEALRAEGLNRAEIARRLGVQPRTVGVVLATIREKVGTA